MRRKNTMKPDFNGEYLHKMKSLGYDEYLKEASPLLMEIIEKSAKMTEEDMDNMSTKEILKIEREYQTKIDALWSRVEEIEIRAKEAYEKIMMEEKKSTSYDHFVEARKDRHGNDCEIWMVPDKWQQFYRVKYAGSPNWWSKINTKKVETARMWIDAN